MKANEIKTLKDAQRFCEGVLNDFESGISTKEETLIQFRKYTMALHEQFWLKAKGEIEKNPNYFNQKPIKLKKTIEDRKRDFYNLLIEYKDDYPKEMLREFYEYWTEHGEKDRKFRKEKQTSFNLNLRLKRWFRNYKPKTPTSTGTRPMTITERLLHGK